VVQKDNYHEMEDIIDLGQQYGADRVWLNKIEDWGTLDDYSSQNIWGTKDFQKHLERVMSRMHETDDRFIECPTLITDAARHRPRSIPKDRL
jgi:MoaA/NifB/PqqE/SkfB family radical SAM enzyme